MKVELTEGQVVWLKADPEEGWQREQATVLESGSFELDDCVMVEVLVRSGPEDLDGLREVMVYQIEV